jgi:hypothetical protein
MINRHPAFQRLILESIDPLVLNLAGIIKTFLAELQLPFFLSCLIKHCLREKPLLHQVALCAEHRQPGGKITQYLPMQDLMPPPLLTGVIDP